ncbi:death domain-containing protein 1 isoform 1-T1 [Odontesthes bonariensis]|uniref:death domain-containing protein 1 isoform X1 n=1 Tax=Odontesthes bonariensis TaxID=219752 RepID=UPI003F58E22D
METNLHVSKRINEANPPLGTWSEDGLIVSTEVARRVEGVRGCRNHGGGSVRGSREEGELSPSEDQKEDERRSVDKEQEEKACKQKVLGVLRELSVFHSEKLTDLREVIRECALMCKRSPPGGGVQRHPDITECKTRSCSDSLSDTFLSVEEGMEDIMGKLGKILTKLDSAVLQLSSNEASAGVAETAPEPRDTETSAPEGIRNDQLKIDLGSELEAEEDQSHTSPSPDSEQTPDTGFTSSDCNKVEETGEQLQIHCPVFFPETPVHRQTETEKEINDAKKEDKKSEWITVGLTDQLEDGSSDVPDACFIRAPPGVAEGLRCEAADALSCLMVSSSEELVSRVIQVKAQRGASLLFPVTVAVPFRVQHRGSYRDVAVKIVDEEKRVSYVAPVTTEGVYEGQKGSFAEVKVYSLGLFAVVYCLKRENYIIPKRGLSLKLPMDSRICLNYLPGSFAAPVMAQTMIQPVDAVLLAAARSRNDAYKPVVSASPLLYLTHPTSQPLRRALTVTLPCPPNPEKNRDTRGQDHRDCQRRTVRASLLPSDRVRTLNATVKSKEIANESLLLLGSRDKQWSVLDKVAVRNQQIGLVSFDLMENLDSLLVLRLLAPPQPCLLVSLAEELEECARYHNVTVVLQRQKDEPHSVLVAALPSRDLSWELSKLRAQGHGGDLVETSSEISMCEADQLLLRFSGNISSAAFGLNNQNEGERLTFHSQRKNQLWVRLAEVDPFGNYSSPHYKGTVLFYRVSRGQLEWRGDNAVLRDTKLLGDPICKMPLTLPKKVRIINRPLTARVKLCEDTGV